MDAPAIGLQQKQDAYIPSQLHSLQSFKQKARLMNSATHLSKTG